MIYLDANATARLRPSILGRLAELCSENSPRNPSSVHRAGQAARAVLREARTDILRLLNQGEMPGKQKLIFTSGGTEACNLLCTAFLPNPLLLNKYPQHLICSAFEHPAILEPLRALKEYGCELSEVKPEPNAKVSVEAILNELRPNTALIALMTANNETGAIQPICELARALRARGSTAVLISDFVQALGKCQLSARELFSAGVNAIAVSGHKIGAASGIGAVVIDESDTSRCLTFSPLLRGGAQEQGFRAGTENLPGALAFGQAAKEAWENREQELSGRRALRDLLKEQLKAKLPELQCFTPEDAVEAEQSICNTLSLRFPNCRADDLLVALDLEGVCVSAGSACSSGKQGPSNTMLALGLDKVSGREVLRLSLDWDIDREKILTAAEIISTVVRRMNR